jgi:hypothetical protein
MTIGRTIRAGAAGVLGVVGLGILAGCAGDTDVYPPAARGTSVYDPDTAGEIYEEGYEAGVRDRTYGGDYGVRRTEGGYRCNPGLIFDC